MKLNTEFVRAQFPALSGDWIFFDNAGGSQILAPVAANLHNYLLTTNVQLGASYDISRQAGERVAGAATEMATLINAADPGEIIMGPSTTMLMKILSLCLSETFSPGDEIIVTNCDHEANIGCWRSLERRGFVIKEWRLNPETLELHLDDLENLMTHKTRLVAVTHVSNILGTLNPIKEFASFIHEQGAMICVDGVAYAPHRRIDVQDLDVDFYAFSFYKVYGPHYSLLYGKKEHLLNMPGINHFFIKEDNIPYKFQPGSVNYELSSSMSGLCEYLKELAEIHEEEEEISGLSAAANYASRLFAEHEEQLATRFLDFLKSKSNVRIIGCTTPDRHLRVPTFSFVVENIKSSEIPPKVDKHKIGIRWGDFYARRLIQDLGLMPQDGVVRVSMVHYNTLEEVDKLIKIMDNLF